MMSGTVIAGASLLEITETRHGLVIGCPGCGAQQLVPSDEEPLLEHDRRVDCPVFRTIVRAFQLFVETKEVRA